ncbi:MAG: choice-of-anchor tandem repeat GloVer-containing protein [Bacteroidota bacterium]
MKRKICFVGAFIITTLSVHAQRSFIGTTENGGGFLSGSIFKIDTSGTGFETLYSFPVENRGKSPDDALLEFTDGLYYGTARGGLFNSGVLFTYDFTGNNYKVRLDFGDSLGGPTAQLITNGTIIYGALGGSTTRNAALFSYNPTTEAFNILYEFISPTGGSIGDLILDGDILYGSSTRLTGSESGYIWQYNLVTESFDAYNFNQNTDGINPAGLVLVDASRIYGYTGFFGPSGAGNLFEYNIASNTLTVLEQFSFGATGNGNGQPSGGLTLIGNDLYGSTSNGGLNSLGSIYKLSTTNNSFSLVYSFSGDGPSGDFTLVDANKLIGATETFIYEYDLTTDTFAELYTFEGEEYFTSELITVNSGELLGTMPDFGFSGSIFSFDLQANQVDHKVLLNQTLLGERPSSGLTLHSNGLYYGVTRNGGEFGFPGAFYEYNAAINQVKVLHAFNDNEGFFPVGELTEVNNGKLYGVTSNGGASSGGIIFSYDPNSSSYTIELEFDNTTGRTPQNGMILADNGNLYGTTLNNGSSNFGTLYEFNPQSGSITTLINFDRFTNGRIPQKIMQASDGKLYGITNLGGANLNGLLYSYDLSNSIFTVEHDFAAIRSGIGQLVQDGNLLYGITAGGGSNNTGTIFSYNIQDVLFSVEHEFVEGTGVVPNTLEAASNGELFGTTTRISLSNRDSSVLFKYNPSTSAYRDLEYLNSEVVGIAEICLKPVTNGDLEDVTLCVGENLNVLIETLNTDSFIWRKEGALLNNQTGSTFALTSLTGQDSGSYSVELVNLCGSTTLSFDLRVIDIQISTSLNDAGNGLEVTATGGDEPYEYSVDGISFQSDPNFVLPNGQYTFTVRDANGCESTTSQSIAVTSVDIDFEHFQFYPNPVQDVLTLKGLENSTIKIMDSRGAAIIRKEVTEVDEQISLRFLNAGIYLLEINQGGGGLHYFRLLKE